MFIKYCFCCNVYYFDFMGLIITILKKMKRYKPITRKPQAQDMCGAFVRYGEPFGWSHLKLRATKKEIKSEV